MRQSTKTILIWLILILLFVSVYSFFNDSSSSKEKTLDAKAFNSLLADEAKARADRKAAGQPELESPVELIRVYPGDRQDAKFVITYRTQSTKAVVQGTWGDADMEALRASGIPYKIEKRSEGSVWPQLLVSWLPMLLLIAVFFFFMRQLQSGGGKAMSFGKSKARLLTDSQNRITFKDVAGVEEAKEEVEEIIAFLKDPKKFTKLGGRIPKGVLMMGSPGTGKTLLARAIAGEAGVPFFSISGSDFVEMFVGVGASRVRDLFEQGKKNAPCIIFIDEIDAVGRHRGAGLGGGHDEREQTLNQLLVEMDGFESNDGVIIIAATNRPDVLDPALLRPGRFDRRIVVPRPDLRGRIGILNVHVRRVPLSAAVDLEVIARGTPGFSGADLESLVNEAALIAARRDKDKVDMVDFEEAKDKVLMGAERRSMIISEKEKKNTAVHEAGHALVARFVGAEADPVHKVTIIPRGRALGLTQQLPTEDRLSMTREFAQNTICILMGGRVAEEIIFGQKTTGAGNDIERATELARSMVTEWGMSDEFGPLNFAGGKQEVFLGRDFTSGDRHSEDTSQRIDAEIRRIVLHQYERATEILRAHRAELERVADALLDYETIDGDDIDQLLAGQKLARPLPTARRPRMPEPPADDKRPVAMPPVAPSPTPEPV
ncbi:MAG: ATP-dependent zinc metalloprotease FtsH [Kofleriaceae bacterium]|nr:ATP-dependent zinc metalloprotease FtsH [Kofleriaceae bacterium]MBP9172053.1 ATP-dependent zinc metalloprotease FtsH [Kofleriaceae bacterium]MBP9861973.1 ATP-dependent zinc metalloprotease FtsH [Kofleriaceae bacterium]